MVRRPDPSDTRRTRLAVGVAAALHACILFATAPARFGGPPPASQAVVQVAPPPDSIEIAIQESSEVPAGTALKVDVAMAEPSAAGAVVAMRSARGTSQVPSADLPSGEPPLPAAPAASSASSAPVTLFVPSPSAVGIGTHDPNPFLVGVGGREGHVGAPASTTFVSSAPQAPSAAEMKRRADKGFRDAAAQHDAAVGLGPEGPVLHALRDATRASSAPTHGAATFLAVVDAAGFVVSLRLVGATGGDGWELARAEAARSLAGKRLTLRGAKGAELTILVESDVRLPSGATPATPVRPAYKDSKVDMPENVQVSGTSGTVRTVTAGEFDLSDIGAKPSRVVRARLVSITTL